MALFHQLTKVNENRDILQKLIFHLESQAKYTSPKCHPEHLMNLKKELLELQEAIDSLLGN